MHRLAAAAAAGGGRAGGGGGAAKGKPERAGSGPMCATTARLPGQTRQRPCFSSRRIVAGSIRSSIWRAYAGLMQADTYAGFGSSTRPIASQVRSLKLLAGHTGKFFKFARTHQGADRGRGGRSEWIVKSPSNVRSTVLLPQERLRVR